MKKLLFIFLMFGYPMLTAIGSDSKFSASLIPLNLKENAKAVIRYHETILEIKSEGKAAMEVRFAITILSESGIDNSNLTLFYDKFSRIRDIKGAVYDQDGKEVEKVRSDKVMDVSAISGFSIYEDNRMVMFMPGYRKVPYTVEYSYRIDYNGILDYPDFYIFNDYNIGVEKASLVVNTPDTTEISYFERNTSVTCEIRKTNTGRSHSWFFNSILPLSEELYAAPLSEQIPSVLIAPTNFRIADRKGSAKSWEDFGRWVFELNKGRDELPEEVRNKIKGMVSVTSDTLEKIAILYKYLQDKTRYASIQVGLGGWQPFDAQTVDRLSYGDCKALVNYMGALLKVAGIPSLYTLVKAGAMEADINTEFPSSQFNHAILCVPVANDTLWLECTDQQMPLGFIGRFTDNRNVLLVTEIGGKITRTPVYTQKENIKTRISQVSLSPAGEVKAEVITKYRGIFYDGMMPFLRSDDKGKKTLIEERGTSGNIKLERFSFDQKKEVIPEVTENLILTIQNVLVKAGGRMLFSPNLFSKREQMSNSMSDRRNPLFVRHSVCENDTVYLSLPAGMKADGISFEEKVTSPFGLYEAMTVPFNGMIRYTRKLVQYGGTYDKNMFDDFVRFHERISMADNKKIVLTVN